MNRSRMRFKPLDVGILEIMIQIRRAIPVTSGLRPLSQAKVLPKKKQHSIIQHLSGPVGEAH